MSSPTDKPRSEHGADRVVVVESLRPDEFHTGRDLKEDVLDRLKHRLGLEVDLETPQSRRDLLALLEKIARETRQRTLIPMLHFEIHGLDDASGFAMANDDCVPWDDLATPLEDINCASCNNVVVVLATCWGFELKAVMPGRRAPFWALVAPNGPVTTWRLVDGMRAFYEELLSSQDGDKAVEVLNAAGAEQDRRIEYKWRTAEGLFRDHYRQVLRTKFSAEARRTAAEAKVSEVMATPLGRGAGLAKVRRSVKNAIKRAPAAAFQRARDRYLMLDEFPVERSRFTLTYNDCLP